MNPQFVADGLVSGAMIGLGAIGVTLTYSILRFSNFAHGEFISWGAYATLITAGLIGYVVPNAADGMGPFSVGWGVVAAGLVAAVLTGCMAMALDWLVFRRLRLKGASITVVMASFGASMALRALLEFLFTSSPRYFSRDLQIAMPVVPGIRVTPDQMALLGVTAVLALAVHLLLTRTHVGRAMRAVSENPALARVVGIDIDSIIRVTWMLGGALACASGVMLGLVVQIRPYMGFDMLLPLFASAILGGIGSVPGALAGALIVGLSEAAAVQIIGAEWRAAVAFLLLIAVLLVKPTGLAGGRA
jgi:branched-chain amino acid transport system permease protein